MSTEPNRIWTPDTPAGDEDWKDRVQAENRALDESLKAESQSPQPETTGSDATAGNEASDPESESPSSAVDIAPASVTSMVPPRSRCLL